MGILDFLGDKIKVIKSGGKLAIDFRAVLLSRPLQAKRLYDLLSKISKIAESSQNNIQKTSEILAIIVEFKRENPSDYYDLSNILDDFLHEYAKNPSGIKENLKEILG